LTVGVIEHHITNRKTKQEKHGIYISVSSTQAVPELMKRLHWLQFASNNAYDKDSKPITGHGNYDVDLYSSFGLIESVLGSNIMPGPLTGAATMSIPILMNSGMTTRRYFVPYRTTSLDTKDARTVFLDQLRGYPVSRSESQVGVADFPNGQVSESKPVATQTT